MKPNQENQWEENQEIMLTMIVIWTTMIVPGKSFLYVVNSQRRLDPTIFSFNSFFSILIGFDV